MTGESHAGGKIRALGERRVGAADTAGSARSTLPNICCSWAPTSCRGTAHRGRRHDRATAPISARSAKASVRPIARRPPSRPGVNSVSWLLIRFMLVMVPLVLLLNGFTKGDWTEALLFALSVAVGLTPEMLPMIVTVDPGQGRGAPVAQEGHRQAPRRDPELRRDGRAVHRQDRHADRRTRSSSSATSTSSATRTTRCCGSAWLNSYYQTGLKNLLDVAVLRSCRRACATATARDADPLPQGRRDAVRLRAPPHVGRGRRHPTASIC